MVVNAISREYLDVMAAAAREIAAEPKEAMQGNG
jgi:hypothetical protein